MSSTWPPEWLNDLTQKYPFRPNYIEIDGYRLSYIDEGDKSAPCVLLLHGNPTWSFYYRELIKALGNNYRVVVPDHMGCGLSDKPQDYSYTLKTHIANLSKLIDHLKIVSFSMGVHDWGGAIGFGYAVDNVEKIKSLTVFNTAAFIFDRIPLRIRLCRLPLVGAVIVRAFNGFANAATVWGMATAQRNKFNKSVIRGYLAPYDSWENRIAILRFVQDIPIISSDQSHNILSGVDKNLSKLIDKPMTIIWGMRDWCFDFSFLSEWRERFPNAETHKLEKAGHLVVEDENEVVITLVMEFLNRHG